MEEGTVGELAERPQGSISPKFKNLTFILKWDYSISLRKK